MIITTTPSIDGQRIATYHGVVVGEAKQSCTPPYARRLFQYSLTSLVMKLNQPVSTS